jgi:hypothetical protein
MLNLIKSKTTRNQLAYMLGYIGQDKFDLNNHELKFELLDLIKSLIQIDGIETSLKISKQDVRYIDNILEKLQNEKNIRIEFLHTIYQNIKNRSYNNRIKIIQDFSRLQKTIGFKNLLSPILPPIWANKEHLNTMVQLIDEAEKLSDEYARQQYYLDNQEKFEQYINAQYDENLLKESEYELFVLLGKEMLSIFSITCKLENTGNPELQLINLNHTYSLDDSSKNLEFNVCLRNVGDGISKNINLESSADGFFIPVAISPEIVDLRPNEEIVVAIKCEINRSHLKDNAILAKITYQNVFGAKKHLSIDEKIEISNIRIPWEELKLKSPYSTKRIKDRNMLFGRDNILNNLLFNVKKERLDSYKIWGQKRVGKTSIVNTFANELKKQDKVIVVKVDVDTVPDPFITFSNLCESIESELKFEIDELRDTNLRERLNNQVEIKIESINFKPVRDLFKSILRKDDELKIVLIIDEFDKLNEEFFFPGPIGDAFSLGLGKNVQSEDRVSVILVGAENMKLLDYHQMNYNEFIDIKVDFFDKKTQYSDFIDLVQYPVKEYIKFSEESIELIYNYSGGNPYFSNLICHEIFDECEKSNRSNVEKFHVERGVQNIVRSTMTNHFSQYWDDGLVEQDIVDRNSKIDIRKRLLIGFNLYFHQSNEFPKKRDLLKNFIKTDEYKIPDYVLENIFNEFLNRNIFVENKIVRIRPLLFEEWLICEGKQVVLSAGHPDLEAKTKKDEIEEKLKISDGEIAVIQEKLVFKNEKLEKHEIQDFLKQFGPPSKQRLIFRILNSVLYISNAKISEFLRHSRKIVFRGIEFREIAESGKSYSKSINRKFEVFTPFTLLKENEEFYSIINTLYGGNKNKVIKTLGLAQKSQIKTQESVIILVPALVKISKQIQDDLKSFIEIIREEENIPPISLLSFVATRKDISLVNKLFKEIHDFECSIFREITEPEINPYVSTAEIFDHNEAEEFFFLSKQYMPEVSKDEVSILFETHCPRISHSILWRKSETFTPLFLNDTEDSVIDLEGENSIILTGTTSNNDVIIKVKAIKEEVSDIEEWLRHLIYDKYQVRFPRKMLMLKHLDNQNVKEKINSEIIKEIKKRPTHEKSHLEKLNVALNFITLSDVLAIMHHNDTIWKDMFEEVLGGHKTFETRLGQLLEFRNMEAHIKKLIPSENGLGYDTSIIDECELGLKWFKSIKDKYESSKKEREI